MNKLEEIKIIWSGQRIKKKSFKEIQDDFIVQSFSKLRLEELNFPKIDSKHT